MKHPILSAIWLRLLWISLLLGVLVAGAAFFVDRILEEQALAPIKANELQRAVRRADTLQRALVVPVEDVLALSHVPSVRDAARGFSPAALDRLSEIFVMLSETGTMYGKVRLFDAEGAERLRINKRAGHATRVPQAELQNKASRYFLAEARNIPEGSVYISRIDLNVDQGKIEVPYVPTLRVSTPIRDEHGKLLAMLVINVEVQQLSPLFNQGSGTIAPVWMVDHEGFWLMGPRPELEWGFQLGRPQTRLGNYEPGLARLALEPSAQIRTPSGLWSLARVDVPDVPTMAPVREGTGQFRGVIMVSRIPEAKLQEAVTRIRRVIVTTATIVGLLLIVLTAGLLAAYEARKQQADEAENARQRLRLALVGGGLSMWIFDLSLHSLYLNASWQKITGYVQGPTNFATWIALFHEEDRGKLVAAFEDMQSGTRSSIDLVLRLRHQAGHWLTVAVYGGVVNYSRDGRSAQAAGVLRDLSEIEHSQKRLELAMHGGDMSWWDWNIPGRIINLDARWGNFLGEEDRRLMQRGMLPVSRFFEESVHPDDREALGGMLAKIVLGESKLIASEHRIRNHDNAWVWVLARGEVSERNEQGMPTRVLGTVKDISARKQLELELREERRLLEQRVTERTHHLELAREEAERANKAKNTFLANISHEMRTPMHGIIGFADMGDKQSQVAPREQLKSYFSSVVQSASRLLSLINDLLDISKLDSGMMSFHMERVDPLVVLASNIAEIEPLAWQKKLHLQLKPQEDLPYLHADPIRLGQVLRNLLANSVRYSTDGATIVVSAERVDAHGAGLDTDGPALRIEVSDEGCGIPPAELELIFDKFVQSSRTRSGAGGTGLGLSICREIVSHHAGLIRARNNPEGGATFEVVLPAYDIDESPASAL